MVIRFSLLQLLLFVTWLSICLALAHLLGIDAAVGFGGLIGIGFLCIAWLACRRQRHGSKDRLIVIAVLAIILGGVGIGIYGQTNPSLRFDRMQWKKARHLQSVIDQDVELSDITANYNTSGYRSQRGLHIDGHVSSYQAFDKLCEIVNSDGWEHAHWNVLVKEIEKTKPKPSNGAASP